MSILDWSIVAGFLLLSVSLGVFFSKKASGSMEDFFLSGRNLPWWAVGFSIVATTFASDTPLAVTEYIRSEGLWRNWFWWCLAATHVMAAVVFAPLWRRAGILTDMEFIELRYGGRKAAALRLVKSATYATIYNFIVMGWVTAAMSTVLVSFADIPLEGAIVACMVIALVYSTASGLWGVVATDLLQVLLALVGSAVFALVAVSKAGGLQKLLGDLAGGGYADTLALFPPAGNKKAWLDMVVFLSVVWWANHGADGGGYIIQRMMAARSEKEAMRGTFLFSVVHYVVRLWPWVLVAMVSIVLFPSIGDRQAYPHTLAAILPHGLKGICVAIFLAAFMSTIDTHLNWGASYVVNDLYKRFVVKDAPQGHYVAAARITSVLLMLLAAVAAYFIDRISSAWEFLWSMGAGLGPVLVLRWFWWRVNAWTEITALAGSFTIAAVIQVLGLLGVFSPEFHEKALLVVFGTAILWLPVTFLTGPEDKKVLEKFRKRVKPPGRWPGEGGETWPLVLKWLAGVASVYALMFGAGMALIGSTPTAGIGLVIAGIALGVFVWR